MREFKFRAWDKETKEMSDDFLSKNWLKVCIESPYVELMQYTGLTDRNGKEIYESDVMDIGGRAKVIEWNDLCAQWAVRNPKTGIGQLDINADLHEYEVIGNVFENGDLIHDC